MTGARIVFAISVNVSNTVFNGKSPPHFCLVEILCKTENISIALGLEYLQRDAPFFVLAHTFNLTLFGVHVA